MIALLLAALSGCSLMGLDDFEVARCATDADCERVDTARGIAPEDCEHYFCEDRLCRLGRGERCDGVDNDCNGLIDDLDATRDSLASLPRGEGEIAVAHFGDGPEDTGKAVWIDATGASIADGDEGMAASLVHARNMRIADVCDASDVTGRCFRRDDMGLLVDDACDPVDVVLSGTTDRNDVPVWLVGTIDQIACEPGRVRFGFLDDTRIALRADQTHGNVAAGVDPGSPMPCTGASRPSAGPGASSLAIAALPSNGERLPLALAAWSTLPTNTDRSCGAAPPAAIEALAVWIEIPPGPTVTRYANATDREGSTPDAQPETLPIMGTGTGPPAIAATPDGTGWWLGHAADGGGIALRFVPAFDPPHTMMMCGAEALAAPALTLGDEEIRIAEGRTVERVVAAALDATRVAVAWQEGCGASAQVWVATVRRSSGALVATDPVRASGEDRPATRVAIAATDLPFRSGGTGGVIVAWIAAPEGATGEVAARRLELDGDGLSPEPRVRVLAADPPALTVELWSRGGGAIRLFRHREAEAPASTVDLTPVVCLADP